MAKAEFRIHVAAAAALVEIVCATCATAVVPKAALKDVNKWTAVMTPVNMRPV
jgi:hypothetical protein